VPPPANTARFRGHLHKTKRQAQAQTQRETDAWHGPPRMRMWILATRWRWNVLHA